MHPKAVSQPLIKSKDEEVEEAEEEEKEEEEEEEQDVVCEIAL